MQTKYKLKVGITLHITAGLVFKARCYASAVYAISVCLSVTRQCSIEITKHIIA